MIFPHPIPGFVSSVFTLLWIKIKG